MLNSTLKTKSLCWLVSWKFIIPTYGNCVALDTFLAPKVFAVFHRVFSFIAEREPFCEIIWNYYRRALSLLLNLCVFQFPCLEYRNNNSAFSKGYYEDWVKYYMSTLVQSLVHHKHSIWLSSLLTLPLFLVGLCQPSPTSPDSKKQMWEKSSSGSPLSLLLNTFFRRNPGHVHNMIEFNSYTTILFLCWLHTFLYNFQDKNEVCRNAGNLETVPG